VDLILYHMEANIDITLLFSGAFVKLPKATNVFR